MKNLILFVISFMIFTALSAQKNDNKVYVLHINDKGISQDALLNPSSYLSEKAVERRLKQKIAFDLTDVPVNESYIKEVVNTGARILTRSRWFNTIVVEASPLVADQLSKLYFINEVEYLDKVVNQNGSLLSVKPHFESEKISPWSGGTAKNATADFYNYGSAYNQINQLKGQYLHNRGFRGQGMTIAVIDAGFNSVDKMPCFDSLRSNNQIKGTRDFAKPGNNVYSTSMHSHGTSVLSCMAANVSGEMIGTAPKADYWLLRSEVGESEKIIEEYYWVSAAEFADSIGVDLINSSLGYTTFDDVTTNHTYAQMDGNTTYITKGADKAAEKGILVVNSAGNDGSNSWKYIGAPADGDSVFTIGSVTATGYLSSFSSVGPTSDGRIKPTVAAQGSSSALYSPSGFGTGSGTSFSSPIICGITACLWQAFPELNNMQIIEAIKNNASQSNQPDPQLGWGIPNYEKALTTLSTNFQVSEKALFAYPNPAPNTVTIGFPVTIHGQYKLEIINMQGVVVYSNTGIEKSIRSFQVNELSKFPSGVYLIKVSNGTYKYTGRIIKL